MNNPIEYWISRAVRARQGHNKERSDAYIKNARRIADSKPQRVSGHENYGKMMECLKKGGKL